MANKKTKGSTKTTEENPFTVDTDNSVVMEVPTISRLLNRKKYTGADEQKTKTNTRGNRRPKANEKTKTSTLSKQPQLVEINDDFKDAPTDHKRQEQVINLPVEASGLIEIQRSSITISSTAKIQAIQPRASGKPNPILDWTADTLRQSADPLAKALTDLMDRKSLSGALFLAIKLLSENTLSAAKSQQGVPFFVGSAAVTPGTKAPYWRGLVWDPSIVPELWNQFIQDGMVELAPPGPNTVVTSERNVVRAAMGTGPKEWVILVRVGTTDLCRGIVALFSENSLAADIKRLSALFFSPGRSEQKVA